MSVVTLLSNISQAGIVKLLMKFSAFLCVVLFLSGCATDPAKSEETRLFSGNILDEENLFDENTETELSNFLDSLEEKTGIDFVLATVTDPGSEGLIGYAAAMTRKISPGQPGLNNGAIIYLSDYSREVKVECGYGMEWYVSDTASGFIIENMRPFLVEGDYKNAARKGFLEIAQLASTQDWRVEKSKWAGEDIPSLTSGMVLQITGKGIARAYQEGVPEATQFHPNYFIDIFQGEMEAKVYFSGYMRDMVDQIVYSELPVEINCVVLQTEPLQLGLLGIQNSTH